METLTAHLPHIVWVRYLGSTTFKAVFKGTMKEAEAEVYRVRRVDDPPIGDTYLLPEGYDVDEWHQKRLNYDRELGLSP